MSHVDGFISGSVAGAAGLVVGQPFDTIKVRLQTSTIYNNVTHCFRRIVTEEGVRALYKGMLAPMVSVSAMNAVFFGVYTGVLRLIDNDIDTPKISNTFVAGTVSGMIAGCISGPTELIKCRLQVAGISTCKSRSSNIAVIRQIYETQGIKGLARGLPVTVMRELVSCGFYFSIYEWIVQYFRGSDKDITDLRTYHLLIAGGLSGSISWAVNYPVDVIKSRLQIDGMNGAYQYRHTVHCYRALKSQIGIKGLYRGMSATILRAFPTNAAMLPAYSVTLALLTDIRTSTEKMAY